MSQLKEESSESKYSAILTVDDIVYGKYSHRFTLMRIRKSWDYLKHGLIEFIRYRINQTKEDEVKFKISIEEVKE